MLKTLSQKTRKNFFYRSVDRHQIQNYGIFDAGSFFVFWVAGIARLRIYYILYFYFEKPGPPAGAEPLWVGAWARFFTLELY
ncbi:MAG: hypothetical protein DRH24_01170 [Deltaproteobacteria bacterium]|nr:MAG: hypothetical protein DRH24_01170 [Deltaproteobacteria bacterium]